MRTQAPEAVAEIERLRAIEAAAINVVRLYRDAADEPRFDGEGWQAVFDALVVLGRACRGADTSSEAEKLRDEIRRLRAERERVHAAVVEQAEAAHELKYGGYARPYSRAQERARARWLRATTATEALGRELSDHGVLMNVTPSPK